MSKAYKTVAKIIPMGDRKGEKVYTIRPVSYGLLNTAEVAKQISAESTATPADVLAVLDRYAYYVKENLRKGYDVELLGFGTLSIRFVIGHAVSDIKLANSRLVNSMIPQFRPAYTILNGKRIYNLMPDKISLVAYDSLAENDNTLTGANGTPTQPDGTPTQPDGTPTEPDNTPSGGGSTSGGGTGGSGSNGNGEDALE